MIEIGAVIDGKYKILSIIGQGGMSTVYLAINAKANKPWAIKEVRKDGFQSSDIVKQSLSMEIDLLKKLRHPNLPSIIDIIDQDDNFLIVMDYIEGMTLENIIRENGAQNQKDVIEWAIQLCDVLQYLHSREPSIIYRDMKPSNIMLNYDGKVVLIDFGTAREYKERALGDTTCLGTKGYAAPEQFGGQGQTDPRTDIYSMGATMYHLLTGHNPSEPPYEMYPITCWNTELSDGLERIIQRCTQQNPEDRFQTVEELAEALKNYKDLETPVIHRYRKTLGVFFILCLLTVCSGSLSYMGQIYANTKQETQFESVLTSVQQNASEISAYGTYWQSLVEFKQLNDSEDDRQLMTLQLYEKMIIHSMEHIRYLKQDGINETEVKGIYRDIETDIGQMEQGATEQIQIRIDELRRLMSQAEQEMNKHSEEEK